MLRLYDTRTRQVRPVQPARRGALRIYSPGPAVYQPVHAGHLRSYLLADLVRRAAEGRRLQVVSCQDISDVGSLAGGEPGPPGAGRAIPRAVAGMASARDLARRYEQAFQADCAALNIHPANYTPRVSESADRIIETIAGLLETGHAYQAPGGSVYFDARSYPGYGELSGNRLDDRPPGHPPGGEAGPEKRFPADWALWHAAPDGPGELTWGAPWGTGVPGRPAACSALSLHALGPRIDVHTGGLGRRFPQDEEERAQSNTLMGREVVGHWVHGGQLRFAGRDMAASAGNVVHAGDVAERGLDPLALRLACLEQHYRQPLDLTWDMLAVADRTLRRWRDLVAEWARSPSESMVGGPAGELIAAFDDDLDTPAALRALHGLERGGGVTPGAKFETFAFADQLLGLDLARDVGR